MKNSLITGELRLGLVVLTGRGTA